MHCSEISAILQRTASLQIRLLWVPALAGKRRQNAFKNNKQTTEIILHYEFFSLLIVGLYRLSSDTWTTFQLAPRMELNGTSCGAWRYKAILV